MRSRWLVVVPAYNEADSIEYVVRRAQAYADVCVVDDASTDGTGDIVASIAGAHLIRHATNTHISGAILDGFRLAEEWGYPFCITMDAGLSHDPDAIPKFQAVEDADLVIGYRAERIGVPYYRRVLSRYATRVVNLALERRFVPWGGARFRDATSGYRMYSRAAYSLLVRSRLRSHAFAFHLEALAYVVRQGLRVVEVPIRYSFTNSSLRPGAVGEALRTCARIWVGTLD